MGITNWLANAVWNSGLKKITFRFLTHVSGTKLTLNATSL